MERKKTNTIAGIVITAMIAYGTFSLISTLDQLHEAESQCAELKAEITQAQEENKTLARLISEADSDSAKEELAKERLGLVKPCEIVFMNRK